MVNDEEVQCILDQMRNELGSQPDATAMVYWLMGYVEELSDLVSELIAPTSEDETAEAAILTRIDSNRELLDEVVRSDPSVGRPYAEGRSQATLRIANLVHNARVRKGLLR